MSRIDLIRWYLAHPSYYANLLAITVNKIESRVSPQAYKLKTQKSTEWCESVAINREDALARILGKQPSVSFEQEFSEELLAARQRADAVPVKMGGRGDIELIYQLAEYVSALNVIETGVAYGWSSLALLLSLNKRQGSRLISTDMPYYYLQNDEYVGCVVPESLRSNWTLLRLPDRAALPQALRMMPTIDLCHYDSDKSYNGRMWAYPRLWSVLRPGGILLSDDIEDNRGFRDFSDKIGQNPYVVRSASKYVGILIKPSA